MDKPLSNDKTKLNAWIKYNLELKEYSFARIAREHNVSRQAVSKVLSEQSPKWELVISEIIGVEHPSVIWPDRYAINNEEKEFKPK